MEVKKMGFKKEVVDKMDNLLTAAFGLVAALAWNGAILAIFKGVFGTADSIPAMLTYAIMVTIIAVIAMIWISRVVAKAKR
jgi:ABC-type antimicrobial peptide transport system permease subunit